MDAYELNAHTMGGTCQFQTADSLLHTKYCHWGETGSVSSLSISFVACYKYNYFKTESLKKFSILTTMNLNTIQMDHRIKFGKNERKSISFRKKFCWAFEKCYMASLVREQVKPNVVFYRKISTRGILWETEYTTGILWLLGPASTFSS